MDRPPGLRERKKAAIPQALHEAALRLVDEHGLEHLTVEAIADAASLSRRTFSNHFSSKEEALFYSEALRTRTLLKFVHERPVDENPRTAFVHAAQRLAAETSYQDSAWLAHRHMLRRHPALAEHHAAAYAATELDLTAEIASRLPEGAGSLRARVLAATFLAALRAATVHWLDAPERPLADVIAEALRDAQE